MQGGQTRGLRLQQTPDGVERRGVVLELGDEADGGQQQRGVERRHVGAVAVPGLEDAERAERVDALAQGAAGDAEGDRESFSAGSR